MTIFSSYNTILERLTPDTTVITPNRRLSATLHKLYQSHQIQRQEGCWETPDILPVSTWIQRLWRDYSNANPINAPLMLNAAQERYLWESNIAAAKESNQLLQISETADIAKAAWSLLKQWQVDINLPVFTQMIDYAALHHWGVAFEAQCATNQRLDLASLTDLIIKKIKLNEIIIKQKIILIGFTELSPQLRELINCCSHEEIQTYSESTQQAITLKDSEDEILTMARWAHSISLQYPEATIGCVIPALDQMRDRVHHIFLELFNDRPFNISAGKPLSQYPMINTALQLLNLYKKNISLDTFSNILTTPFLGDAEAERIRRANLDCQLRRDNISVLYLPKDMPTRTCPKLARLLKLFFDKLDNLPTLLPFSQWATLFHELLLLLGWPGERSLNSHEFQLVEHWMRLLEEYSTLDQVATSVTMQTALQLLQKITSKTIFQPKSPDAPIQILGLLEAAGLPFDFLWVAGMDDMSWPPQPKPNPFIPKSLQRERQMPHATAERELIYCQNLTQQFNNNAKQIIFSHVEKIHDLEVNVSPLIHDIPKITIEDLLLPPHQSLNSAFYHARAIENIADNIGPVISSPIKINGGVSVLKQQALCPFKAFAEWRLHARELETPLTGFRAKDRGSILHRTLEIIWNHLQHHEALCAYSEASLKKLIAGAIDDALISYENTHYNKPRYLALEKTRLLKLIYDWLQYEKERPPFNVLINEQTNEVTLNQLTLTVRIDRIDTLSDGKKMIIDYKTGKNNDINLWLGERPEEPQLPLYLLLDYESTAGIAFAQIAPGHHGFKGISHYSVDINGIITASDSKKSNHQSWSELASAWKTTLNTLSDHFAAGIAHVDPKNGNDTCQWCALKPLCRINEERISA